MKKLARGVVRITTDVSQPRRDRYNRLLAYVNQGSKDLGRTMLTQGLATVYVVGYRFNRYRGYKRAEAAARKAGRGSWGTCVDL